MLDGPFKAAMGITAYVLIVFVKGARAEPNDAAPTMRVSGGIDQIAAQPRSRDSVRSSSVPASRLQPTTSATRIAASLRVSPMAHPLGVTQNSTKASP